MEDNVNKLRFYFYLFVVLLIVGFLILDALKNKPKEQSILVIAVNEQTSIAPWPPDLVPHIREIGEPEPRKPSDMTLEEWEEYKRYKEESKNVA